MIRTLLPIQLLCRNDLQHALLRIRHILEVEHNTVRNGDLSAEKVQPACDVKLCALIDGDGTRTKRALTDEGLRIIFGHNTERGECQRVHVEHSILSDMDAVRIDKRNPTAARLAQRHAGGQIVLVGHGGMLDMLYRHAMRLPLQEPRSWPLANAAINRLLYTPEGLTLIAWADTFHFDQQEPLDERSQ